MRHWAYMISQALKSFCQLKLVLKPHIKSSFPMCSWTLCTNSKEGAFRQGPYLSNIKVSAVPVVMDIQSIYTIYASIDWWWHLWNRSALSHAWLCAPRQHPLMLRTWHLSIFLLCGVSNLVFIRFVALWFCVILCIAFQINTNALDPFPCKGVGS